MKRIVFSLAVVFFLGSHLSAQELAWPPKLSSGKAVASGTSPTLLVPTTQLNPGTKIAKTAPVVDFAYYHGQAYPGNPWSVWGESLVVGDEYYSAIGDHTAPGGNAFVYRYNAKTKELKQVVDVRSVLKMPEGHYTPGKIHSRLDLGSDGWLYFSTHRGSTRTTVPKNHYKGDWILRYHPVSGKTEIVAHAPLPNQCLPTGFLDPDRLIFYSGTADGDYKVKGVKFLAYDIKSRKVLYTDNYGPHRCAIFAKSTGRFYFHGNTESRGGSRSNAQLVRFDPENPGPPQPIDAVVGLRGASDETSDGYVYTVNNGEIWQFNTKTEKAVSLGHAEVGSQTYIASIDIDPKTNRYLYFVAGAHGGGQRDGSPLVQFDIKTKTSKVICFLNPYCYAKYGYIPMGTYGSAVSPEGDKVYITWNGNYGTKKENLGKRIRFNACAMTVVHIPESERQP